MQKRWNVLRVLDILCHKIKGLTLDTKFSEIFIGSVWAFSARVFASALGFINSIIVARLYGSEMVGVVSVLNSFLLLVTIFTVLGTNTSILRLIPEYVVKYSFTSAFRVYRKTQFMVIIFSLFTGTLFFLSADFIASRVFSKPHLSSYFALATLFIVFQSLTLFNTSAVRSVGLIRTFAFMEVFPTGVNMLLLVCLTIFFYNRNNPVYTFLASLLITGTLGWIIMEYTFKKRMHPEDVIHPISVRNILRISLPMFMTATMSYILGQIGVIMLGIFRTEAEVGYYTIAVKLATLTAFVLAAINSVVAPKFSSLFHLGKIDELFYIAKKSTKLVFWMTTPVLIGFLLFGETVLTFFYGPEFVVSYPALVFIVIGQFVNSISGSTSIFMNMTGEQKRFRNIIFVSTLINIGVNLFLTPKIGICGPAIAFMVSISFLNIATLIWMRKKYRKTTAYFPILHL